MSTKITLVLLLIGTRMSFSLRSIGSRNFDHHIRIETATVICTASIPKACPAAIRVSCRVARSASRLLRGMFHNVHFDSCQSLSELWSTRNRYGLKSMCHLLKIRNLFSMSKASPHGQNEGSCGVSLGPLPHSSNPPSHHSYWPENVLAWSDASRHFVPSSLPIQSNTSTISARAPLPSSVVEPGFISGRLSSRQSSSGSHSASSLPNINRANSEGLFFTIASVPLIVWRTTDFVLEVESQNLAP